jgi:phage baseplate assembly protein V
VINHFAKLIAPYARRLSNMVSRGTVLMVDATGQTQRLQISLTAGDPKDGVEQIEPYGLTSHPHPGGQHVTAFLGGDRGNGITLIVGDIRYRLIGLAEGEVALYDDLGQQVHLTRNGIVINGAGKPITLTNASKVRMETNLEVTGEIKDNCDASGKTMSSMRTTYNSHVHVDPQGGSVSATTQTM